MGGREMHRLLTAIRKNKLLSEVGPDEMAPPDAWLKSADEMAQPVLRQRGRPRGHRQHAPDRRRVQPATRNGQADLPEIFLAQGNSARTRRRIAAHRAPEAGAPRDARAIHRPAHDQPTPEVVRRLDYELAVIDDLHFSEYFLIVWDIVNFALRKGIPIVGRGSAANSLVAYCLGITSADPLAHDLYFERFLNRSRTRLPGH